MGNWISYNSNTDLNLCKEDELEPFTLDNGIHDAKILSIDTPCLMKVAIKLYDKPQKFKIRLYGVESERYSLISHKHSTKDLECIKKLKELTKDIIEIRLINMKLNGEIYAILFDNVNDNQYNFENSINQYLVDTSLLYLTPYNTHY